MTQLEFAALFVTILWCIGTFILGKIIFKPFGERVKDFPDTIIAFLFGTLTQIVVGFCIAIIYIGVYTLVDWVI